MYSKNQVSKGEMNATERETQERKASELSARLRKQRPMFEAMLTESEGREAREFIGNRHYL